MFVCCFLLRSPVALPAVMVGNSAPLQTSCLWIWSFIAFVWQKWWGTSIWFGLEVCNCAPVSENGAQVRKPRTWIQPQLVQSSYCDMFSSLLQCILVPFKVNYCEIIWHLAKNQHKFSKVCTIQYVVVVVVGFFCGHFQIKPPHFLTIVKYIPVHVKMY